MSSAGKNRIDHEPDSFDVLSMVRDVFSAVYQYKWTVLAICVLTLGAATAYLLIWPPVYVAKATIMLERNEDTARDDFYIQWNVFRKEDPLSELQLMKSVPILEQTIEREQLGYDDIYHPVGSQLRYFWESSWLGTQYYALKRDLFPPDEAVEVSPEVVEYGRTLDDMAKGITIMPVGDSNVGELRIKGPSPRTAQVANTLIDAYLEWRLDMHQREADAAYSILAEQTERVRSEMRELEADRTEFFRENGLLVGTQREMLQVEKLTNVEAEIEQREERIATLKASLEEVETRLAEEDAMRLVASVEDRNSLREAAKLRRLEAEVQLLEAREKYLEESPEVQEIVRLVAALDAMIEGEPDRIMASRTEGLNTVRQELISRRDALRSELVGAQAGAAVLKETAEGLSSRLAQMPAIEAELNRIDHEHGLLSEKYDVLSHRMSQADVSRKTIAAAMPSMRVISYALPPSSKTWPTLKIIYPAALLIGLFLGTLAALIRYYASGTVRRADLVREHGEAQVLGTVSVPVRGRPLTVETRPVNRPVTTRSGVNGA